MPPLTDQPISTVSKLNLGGVDGLTGSIGFAGGGGVEADAEGRRLAVGALRAGRQHARCDGREDEREYPRGSGEGGAHAPTLMGAQARRNGPAQPRRNSASCIAAAAAQSVVVAPSITFWLR